MSEELKLDTLVQRISYLYDVLPETEESRLLLILSYWRVFDGIDIPDWVIKDIMEKGSEPESITRIGRKVTGFKQLQTIIESIQQGE